MGERKKDAIRLSVLSVICVLLTLHVIHWHSMGMYLKMFGWIGTGKTHMVVLYNLGLMLGLGTALGFLMNRVTGLMGHEVHRTEHSDKEKTGSNR